MMQLSKTSGDGSASAKEEHATATQASSELTLEQASLYEGEPPDQEPKRLLEPKLKYRKLRQKLNSMGFQHDDKCLASKEVSSSKKGRIMKLALDLERLTKIQNRDCEAIELVARDINRVLEGRKELDLHLLRQSRFIPALFELLAKVPSFHKAEFWQLLKALELCFRVLQGFVSVSANRDYLILTNRLNGLISFGSWILGREEKKAPNSHYLAVQMLSFRLINSLLLHKSREEDILTITNTTVELILCSQIFKKVRGALTEQLIETDTLTETDTLLELLKFMLLVMRKASPKLQAACDTNTEPREDLAKLVETVAPTLLSYFTLLKETEPPLPGQSLPDTYPQVVECAMGLTIKILNCCCEAALPAFRKAVGDPRNEGVLSGFISSCSPVVRYCKREMQCFGENGHPRTLLNELLILLGWLGLDDSVIQKRMNDCGLLEEVFNQPIQYLMDSYLRDVHIPTICCLVNENKSHLNLFLRDNSPQPIIKALKKALSSHPSLSRKGSTCSLVSMGHIPIDYASANYETDRLAMQLRFPSSYWQPLCNQLQKHA